MWPVGRGWGKGEVWGIPAQDRQTGLHDPRSETDRATHPREREKKRGVRERAEKKERESDKRGERERQWIIQSLRLQC